MRQQEHRKEDDMRTRHWLCAVMALLGFGGGLARGANGSGVGESVDRSGASGTPAVQTGTPLRIMCAGDSITAGYTDNPGWNVPFEFGYRSSLYTRLTNAGYAVQFVGSSPEPWNGAFGKPLNTPSPDLRAVDQDHHRGYGGWGTGGILGKIADWVAEDKPDVVLLMIGINDGGSPGARSNLNGIVQAIVTTKPEARVIVAQITPLANFSQSIVDYNAYIRDTLVPLYQAKGMHVSTVNQYTNLLSGGSIDPKLFSNGINHPNAVAYDRMAQTWLHGIQAVCPQRVPENRGKK
jgi:lysophospholipase L1-like esterase